MTPERYQRVCEHFLRLRGLDAADRAAFWSGHPEESALRGEVESLLAHDSPEPTFFDSPALQSDLIRAVVDAAPPEVSVGAALPDHIGDYRILSLLGAGGMGVVYAAEQASPRRTVALKVIRASCLTPEFIRRFQFEAEVLARLHHPGIAQIFAAGTVPVAEGGGSQTDQPYFAMELVRGRPLTVYAREQRLDTPARITLFVETCAAVQHAHQNGVIHRDLKPANILVPDDGRPKVLDFGVARMTDAARAMTIATSAGQIVGTLGYMSPEQVRGDAAAVDTRADVFALGAVLYELLGERAPFDLAGKSLPEAARVMVDDDPPPLHRLGRAIPAELAAIVAKAMHKDKSQRYASAAALADDLRYYLADLPISAHPPSAVYHLRKFAHRHRTLVGGVLTTLIVLTAGIIGTVSQAVRASDARARAEAAASVALTQRAEAQRQTAIAEAINSFLNEDVLAQARPDQLGREATIRAALDAASTRLATRFEDAPEVAAGVHYAVGNTYYGLGEYQLADTHLRQALDLQLRLRGPNHPSTLSTRSRLGLVCMHTARYDEAEVHLTTAVAGRTQLYGEHDWQTLATLNHLALLYLRQDRLDDAERALHRVLELNGKTQAADSETALTAQGNLAGLYERRGQYDEAEALYLQVLEADQERLGADAPGTLSIAQGLGTLYVRARRYVDAEPLLRDTLERQRRVLGPDHPRTLSTLNSLALVCKGLGQWTAAETLLQETLTSKERTLGLDNPNTLNTVSGLARLYLEQGRYADAAPLAERVLAGRRRVQPGQAAAGTAMGLLAEVYLNLGRQTEAEALAGESLATLTAARGPDHPDTRAAAELVERIAAANRAAD